MKLKTILYVGGPLDGRRGDVEAESTVTETSVEHEGQEFRYYAEDYGDTRIMSALPADEVLRRLVARYPVPAPVRLPENLIRLPQFPPKPTVPWSPPPLFP